MQNVRVSEQDRLLLRLLRQNSRRTVSELSNILCVSRQTVQNRIARLQDTGVIRRFTIDISDAATEAESGIRVMFTLKLHRPACNRIYLAVKRWPELISCWSVAGEKDMVIVADVPAQSELERLRDWLARHPDIANVTTSLILKSWKE